MNSTKNNPSFSINCKGELIDLLQPKVMGILNITPDSFYDGGFYNSEKKIIAQVKKMINDGASIIDIGGYSSRPGAEDISVETELSRVLTVIKAIKHKFPETLISIDTFRSEVAKKAVKAGADIINDISGGSLDKKMFNTVSELNVPYIIMHMKGNPRNMIKKTKYEDVLKEIIRYFSKKIHLATKAGIKDIIIDPGFGFAKNVEQNFNILNNLDYLKYLDKPILIGVSRKSMIYKTLEVTPKDALNGSTVLHTISLLKGAKIIRTHDVKEANEAIKLVSQLNA